MLFLCCRSRSERQGGQGDVVYPIGYSEKPVPDTSIQETDKNLVEKVSTQEDLYLRCVNCSSYLYSNRLFTAHDRKGASVYFFYLCNKFQSRLHDQEKKVWILRLRQLRTPAWLYSVKLINCPSQIVPWVAVVHELNTWMKCIGNILIDQPQLFIRDLRPRT